MSAMSTMEVIVNTRLLWIPLLIFRIILRRSFYGSKDILFGRKRVVIIFLLQGKAKKDG